MIGEAAPAFRPLPALIVALASCALLVAPIPLEPRAHGTLAILVAAAGLWMTEALPIPVTALLIPVLGIAIGVVDAKAAFAGFGDPIVFLFFGTFLLTDAAARHGLNERLAHAVLGSRWVRGSSARMTAAVASLGCGMSAWVNNTATTALLLPLGLSAERFGSRAILSGVLLLCAYAPSLGGLATPVGTAPNLIGLRLLEEHAGGRPSFAAWCGVFAPLAIVSTALATAFLLARARWTRGGASPIPPSETMPAAPGRPWSLAERTLVPLYVVVVLLWITPGILAATPLAGAAW
ncbi:MAG: SLC13 family permease, partial [bacterium]